MNVSCIILSGGRATRMNGIDKGLVDLQGKAMIQHVIARIKPQVNEIMINANREISQYQGFQLPVFRDENPDFIGPLAGFSLGLQHAQYDYVLTVPCDSPLLPLDLVDKLLNGIKETDASIAVATSNGETHPVFCLMKKNVLPSLTQFLQNGHRKVSAWQKNNPYKEIEFNDDPNAFINLNTFNDLNKFSQKR